ncbi:root meristem growth factor 10 [Ziziphus jujuba]|uniref:Root meristem growth factor 10 n=1 Tax=Ziziphus jujuba TaxID=326968 RepID=A0ABM3IV19_ZIZJJ|nr:root meristem growth factor 10 [Ziziphus jujuba]
MSVASCMILLSLLCLISSLACDARRSLGEVVTKPEEKKVGEKIVGVDKIRVDSNVKSSSSTNEQRDIQGDSSAVSTRKLEETKAKASGSKSNKYQKGKLSPAAAVRTDQTVASVSWSVPHKKRGEKQPGFNLDYAPPKTHPPHHN